ncbi:hypothetical protein NDU88_001566 [Pleurodeles waltl]|uniref:Uncharacterized protein n=1 Tax=Pleurodeles waltl TaxID=8319 RepID=A0AAV7UAK4_PLEWA|nr:hypothetical protein NDU88_001566 [Pleurodeles waltl]
MFAGTPGARWRTEKQTTMRGHSLAVRGLPGLEVGPWRASGLEGLPALGEGEARAAGIRAPGAASLDPELRLSWPDGCRARTFP